jgi:hypothetical protein
LPFGITEKEESSGARYTYSDLATSAGEDRTDFLPFLLKNEYSTFYRCQMPGDFSKQTFFNYFCTVAGKDNPYIVPMIKYGSHFVKKYVYDDGEEVIWTSEP